MLRIDIRQLKNLRRFPVPSEALDAGRVKLIAAIEASPMLGRPSAWFFSAAWRPVMAVMIVVVVATGGGTAFAAHEALPGDGMYAVKIAAEGVVERMVFTFEGRFVVQAAHASRRLEETERLLDREELDGEDRAARVRSAMDRYEGHVFVMNEIAVRLETDPKKPEKGRKAFKAAEGVFDRHARLIEAATRVDAVTASAMLDPIDADFSLEADMLSAIPADDGGTDEGQSRRERALKIGASLKRVRADLEDRRKRDQGAEERRVDDPEEGAERAPERRHEEEREDELHVESGARLELRLESLLK